MRRKCEGSEVVWSDEMVEVFLIFLKRVKCNFTNLFLYLKIFN